MATAGTEEESRLEPRGLTMATLAGSSSSGLTRPPTMLEQLLEEINFQRTKELRQMLKDGSYEFVFKLKHYSFGSRDV